MTEFILAFVGSFFAGFLFNIRGQKLFWAGLSGMIGWMAYIFLLNLTGHMILSVFAGAVMVGVYSEIMARILKTPATIFSVPGMFPLVPGIPAYEAIQFLVDKKFAEAEAKLLETLTAALAIAFGIIIITALFRLTYKKSQENQWFS